MRVAPLGLLILLSCAAPEAVPEPRSAERTYHAGSPRATCLAWSPDGRLLAAGTEAPDVRIYNAASGALVNLLPRPSTPAALAWSPDASALAVGSTGRVSLVDPVNGQERAYHELEDYPVRAVAWSPDGRWVAVAEGGAPGRPFLGALHVGDTASGAWVEPLLGGTVSPDWYSLAFSPDSRLLAAGSGQQQSFLHLVPLPPAATRPLEGHVHAVRSLAFLTGGRLLFSLSALGHAQVRELPSGDRRFRLEERLPDGLHGAAADAPGRLLLLAGPGSRLSVIETLTWERLLDAEPPGPSLRIVTLSPRGHRYAGLDEDGAVRGGEIDSLVEGEAPAETWEALEGLDPRPARLAARRLRADPAAAAALIRGQFVTPDAHRFAGLVEGLASDQPELREAAQEALARHGPAIHELATRRIAEGRDPETVSRLRALVQDSEEALRPSGAGTRARRRAIAVLEDLGAPGRAVLAWIAKESPSPAERALASAALAR